LHMDQVGRYPILEKIGSGGMGEVYLARDPILGRKVAIKVLHREFVADSNRLARFEKEAKAASSLEHSGVAHIYEIGEADGVHFIAMQYVEGLTLNERLKAERPSFSQVLDWAIQICEAMEEAHLQGIIHRDLKPQNIMVTEQGQIKVLDFGIAKTLHQKRQTGSESMTDTGMIVGTVQYMSPEQALGKQIDHRSDIFSIGILLFETVTGRLPFRGESTMETLQKILNQAPEPFNPTTNSTIPYEFERIILKCLEKDPARRYQSVSDLLIDLRNLQQETGTEKPTTSLIVSHPKTGLWWTGMVALLLIAVGTIIYFQTQTKPIQSLAVLPFINEAADPKLEYLSDGLTDEIINKLSQVPELKVLSRGTVFRYKGRQIDPRTVGDELDVDALITGSFFQHDDQLRVQVSLVRLPEGNQMWGELYTWKATDIHSMQAQISKDISEKLPQRLSGEVREQLTKKYTSDPQAYQLFLEGRFHLNKRTRENIQLGIQNFQTAISRDPNYAAAYAGLADGYILLANWGFLPADQSFPLAKEAAEKALTLDATLAEAHTSLAYILSSYEWKWEEAEQSYKKAISLNPNYVTAHQWYGLTLTLMGRFDEALREVRTAQQLDPLSLIVNANVGYTLYFARQYDPAIEELEKAKELDPNFPLIYQILGYIYGKKGEPAKSVAALKKAVDLAPDNLSFKADLAWAHAISGEKQKAEEILNQLLGVSIHTYVPPFHLAGICVGLNQKDRAIDWLEKTYNERSDQITYIGKDPRFDSVRQDPRFQDLVRRIGLESAVK
jgi:eukaryotic-like serine/threonine-protein kinase